MSQPNHNFPTFNFNVNAPYYASQSSELNNASFSQWHQQGSGTPLGNHVPSPSRPTMTAPKPRSYQPGAPHRDRVDHNMPNLSLLVPPGPGPGPRPRSAIESNADPITRFYNDNTSPWSSVRLRNASVDTGRHSFSHTPMDFGSYREGPGSDIDSIAPRSDSGYYTHPPHSVISNEPDRAEQELPPEVFQVSNMNVNSATSEPTDMFRLQSDQTSQYSGRSAHHSKDFKCPHCKEVSKCRSDHKKHMLKHEKPFRCDIPTCRRGGKGFTTINDLNRHKKSVHRIGALQNSYQCASENCRNREKIWPRLDNFKQHINRMHRDEDEQDLIRRSAYHGSEPTPAVDGLSVAPMDTTLAGIGTEKQFSGNELDEPVSGISLTPDQDPSPWTFFATNSRDFAMDVDQSNTNLIFNHDPRKIEMTARHNVHLQANTKEPNTGARSRNSSLRLDTLADVASNQSSPDKTGPESRPQLSSAPQTKAEQQRQALQKFSKIIVGKIQSSSAPNSVDLEDVVLRILSSANKNGTDDLDTEVLTKGEALRASQAISNLVKQSGGASSTRPRRPSSKGFSSLNMKICEQCGATLARSCDMKKHMKRHTKPYGCTYPKCHKRFGAKSDWKRHENSQHFQLESFRCQQTSPSSQTPCGELFYRAEMFKSHLQNEHRMTSTNQIDHELKARRIGKNGQGQFWCGFCEEIIRLEMKRNAAWDERFDHIDNHFNKEKKKIEDWLCVEAKKTKGEVLKEVDRLSFDEDDMETYGVGETDESPSASHEERRMDQEEAPMPSTPNPTSTSSSKKRPAPMDGSGPPPPSKRRRVINRYCCSCQSGPWPTHLYVDCLACSHHLCNACTVVDGMMLSEASMMLG